MKRRNVLKGLAMIPLAGTVLGKESAFAEATKGTSGVGLSTRSTQAMEISTVASFMAEDNIFRSIGVEPIINCRGAYTIIGGCLELPPVRQAMESASHNFVQYDELAEGIGQR